MPGAAVQDDSRADTGIDGFQAGFHLRDHAARNDAASDQVACLISRQVGNQIMRLVQDALHIGQQQQAFRLDRRSHRAGHGVGIDIVGGAGTVLTDRSNHRDQPGIEKAGQERGVNRHRLADISQIQHLLDMAVSLAPAPLQLARRDKAAILAR